jgi:hypothetical protein
MYKQALLIAFASLMVSACDNVDDGKPNAPEQIRPTVIDSDKPHLEGNPPQPPNSEKTATADEPKAPATAPATQPAP